MAQETCVRRVPEPHSPEPDSRAHKGSFWGRGCHCPGAAHSLQVTLWKPCSHPCLPPGQSMLSEYSRHLMCPTALGFCKVPVSVSRLISPVAAMFWTFQQRISTKRCLREQGICKSYVLDRGPKASGVERNPRSAREHLGPSLASHLPRTLESPRDIL